MITLFNLPVSLFRKTGKAILINVNGIVTGVLIDEIHNIYMLKPEEILDSSQLESETNADFLQGFVPYQDRILSLVDLPMVLEQGGLLIDEAV